MCTSEACNASFWTKEENKAFENALAIYGDVDQWENIAAAVPGKTVEDIILRYRALVDDVAAIEADLVPLPDYDSSSENSPNRAGGVSINTEGNQTEQAPSGSYNKETRARPVGQRRRGRPWTEEEHRRFLEGMEKYGKGDWQSISRFNVVSKTPTQVASHAQKYFQRLNNEKRKRGASILDITSAETGSTSADQSPPTGRSKVRRATIHDINCEDTGSTSAEQRPTVRGRSEVVKKTNNSSTSKQSLLTEEMKDPGGIILESSQTLLLSRQMRGTGGVELTSVRTSQLMHVSAQMIGTRSNFVGPISLPQMPLSAQPTGAAGLGTSSDYVAGTETGHGASDYELPPFPEQLITFAEGTSFQQMALSAQLTGAAGAGPIGPTSIMYSVTEARYGLFIPHPLSNVAPSTSPMPPPPDQN